MRPLSPVTLFLLQVTPALGSLGQRQDARQKKLASLDQTWTKFTAKQFCNKYDPQKHPSHAAELWKEFNIDKWFEDWLDKTQDVSNWVQDMDKEMHENAQSQYNCANIKDNCDIPNDCQLHYNNGMGPAYWLLNSASRFHTTVKAFKEGLDEARTKQVFNVDGMLEDLNPKTKELDLNEFGILNGAFTIAAGVTAGVTPLTGLFSVIAGAVGIAGSIDNSVYVPDESIKYEEEVYAGYNNTISGMERMLKMIFNPKRQPKLKEECFKIWIFKKCARGKVGSKKVEALPGLTGSSRHPLVRFFSGGRFMHYGFEEQVKEFLQSYITWHRGALASRMLRDQDFVVVINTDITKKELCKGDSSKWWDDENGVCFRTMKHVFGFDCHGDNEGPSLFKGKNDVVRTAMGDKYAMDRKEYYRSSYACAQKGGGKPPSIPDFDGGVPACFFNMPVIEGKFKSWGGPGVHLKEKKGVNTLSSDHKCGYKWDCATTSLSAQCRAGGEGKKWENIDHVFRPRDEIEYLKKS